MVACSHRAVSPRIANACVVDRKGECPLSVGWSVVRLVGRLVGWLVGLLIGLSVGMVRAALHSKRRNRRFAMSGEERR